MSKKALLAFGLTTALSLTMIFSVPQVSAKDSTTLTDALMAGVSGNPEFGAAAESKKATDEQLNQAKAGFLPSLDMRGDAGFEHSDDVGSRSRAGDGTEDMFRDDISLTLTQMMFDGMATLSGVQRQKARVLSSAHRLHATAELVGLSIVEAYLDVLRQRQLLLIAQKNVTEHKSILNLIQDGVDAGRSTEADAEQVKARLAAARANEAVTVQSLKNAESEYRRVVGEVPGELKLPKMPLESLAENVDIEVEETLAHSPTLQASTSDIDAARAETEETRASFYPQLDLQMNARTGNDLGGVAGRDTSAAALVVMNWNLYRGGADTARSREYAHRHQQSKQTHESALRDLENDVRQTWSSMVAAGERAKQFETQALSNRHVVEAYKDQFSLDRRTLLDVLDSQNELFVTRSNTVNTEFLEMFAVYRLMALKGSLLPALGVEYPAIDKVASNAAVPEKGEQKAK